jgi:hypothetical protein
MADLPPSLITSPLDDLVGSQMLGSRAEALADRAIYSKNQSDQTFQDTLKGLTNSTASNNGQTAEQYKGCHPLVPIDCNANKALDQSRENTQKDIETSIGNILNSDKPGYRRTLPFKDENGNVLYDETPGTLQRTNWQLDLALAGGGKGFKLVNGEYTRDGRFKYDSQGRPVTVNGEIPLEICYKDGAPIDWSLKRLKIDFEGNVLDKQKGQILGKVTTDKGERTKVMQYYMERSNVNLPLEFMGLAQKLRLIDLTNGIFGTGAKLDNEAVGILRNL